MWDFSQSVVTFDNPAYLFDGTGPSITPGYTLPAGAPPLYGDRVILPAKKVGETVILPIDFISKLAVGEALTSAVCTATVYTGVDPAPSAIIVGNAAIAGTIVNQSITGGVLGTIYSLVATALTTYGQQLVLTGYLAIVPNLP